MYNITVECKQQEEQLLNFLNNEKMNYIIGVMHTESEEFFAIRKKKKASKMSSLVEMYTSSIEKKTTQQPYKVQVITKPDSYIMLLLDKKGNRINLKGDGSLERLNIFLKVIAYEWAEELRDYGLINNTTVFFLDSKNDKPVQNSDLHVHLAI